MRRAILPALALAALLPGGPVRALPPAGEWLAGDLHVHTCYSHDAWCLGDSNTDTTDAYTLSGSVEERFIEAAARDLDFLAITDHCDNNAHPQDCGQRSVYDPGFGTHGVVGVPGYENSLRGHAQMLGALRVYDEGDESVAAVTAMADALRADGGAFQANHPGSPDATCEDTEYMSWGYGYDVVPDSIEVWNWSYSPGTMRYYDCWLSRGARIAATGGSDSHWISTTAVQGVGNPTTYVFAAERTSAAIVAAIRAGRTTITAHPPVEQRLVLVLEADADGDGIFEAIVGDTVPPGSTMRVRVLGDPWSGVVRVLANGLTIVNEVLIPGGVLEFAAPPRAGWVRAELLVPEQSEARDLACRPYPRNMPAGCTDRFAAAAITSPIYLG